MADRSFTQFVPQNAAATRRPTGKVCAPWQKNRKPDTDTAGSAQKSHVFLCRACPRVKVRRGKSPVRQTRGFPYRHGLRDGLVRPGRVFPYRHDLRDGFVLVRPNDVLPEKSSFEGDLSGRRSFQRRKSPVSSNPARAGFRRQIHANREFVRQPRPFPYRLVSAINWFGKAGVPVPNEADETRKKRKTIIDRGGG